MNNITKILVAISFLFSVVSANAGEMTVTGNMEATYNTAEEVTTGNPLGMDRELKFAATTELDNGMTVSVMQDTSDNLAFGNSQISFGNVFGLATLYVGSDSDPMDAIDDITPSAYEEANGSGAGTFVDVGAMAGQMGLGTKLDVPFLGALNAKYYPKADGAKNADNASSGDSSGSVGSGSSVTLKTDLGQLLGQLEGASITTGYSESQTSTAANTADAVELTAALNYAYGPISFGLQRKYNNVGMTAIGTDATFHNDVVVGIAYAVNDALSLSFNRYTSNRHALLSDNNEQETDAINIGYTIGGMTIGFQDASTDNAGYVLNAKDDTRTLGVAVAF
tara:strand:+ start:367 stop:1377 length:1011 start_codon:yes stop_codon:yes gene_type:complete